MGGWVPVNSAAEAALASWQLPFWPAVFAALGAALYLRGWQALRAQVPDQFGTLQLVAYLGGLAVVLLAVASPLDAFAPLLLQVHMLQHALLTMIAPPLLWLGAPALPLLRGLPGDVAKRGVGPFLAWPALRRAARALAHPVVGWMALALCMAVWHLPYPYELALRSPAWHDLEHASFLTAGLLFWFPVVQPYPSSPHWPRWAMIPYLLLADLQNTLLAALFAFAEQPLYAAYANAPRLAGLDARTDQAAAGALMWIIGSAAYLAAAGAILVAWLSRRGVRQSNHAFGAAFNSSVSPGIGVDGPAEPSASSGLNPSAASNPSTSVRVGWCGMDSDTSSAPLMLSQSKPERGRFPPAVGLRPTTATPARSRTHDRFDLLRVPLLGAALRSLGVRRGLQLTMLLLAAALIADGLLGPQVSPLNLAGVLPWTYWRGAVVIGLLILGNAFCMICPFMLPRELAKRLLPAARAWPRRLRNKWPAVALLVAYLWAYETFDLWDRPALTAGLALAYFAAAFAIDGLFRGAAFCKHLCPIGQFHFAHATVSPFEIQARHPDVCRACATHDCVRGNAQRRGCELELFIPEKRGNLDCTLCFDCVRACPHDNVGLQAVLPAAELSRDPLRSSLRRLSERPDIAALALVCVFGAFANAAGMLEPMLAAERAAAARFGLEESGALGALALLIALVAVPAALACAAAGLARRLSAASQPLRTLVCRGALALVPLGLAMWSAHFLFHFLSGIGSLAPVVQRVAGDLGSGALGAPVWVACPTRTPDWLTALELLLLGTGLVISLVVGWRTALDLADGRAGRALRLQAPWALVSLLLWMAGAWIVFQPMQMRGMVH